MFKRKKKDLLKDSDGYVSMTKTNLKIICENDELYDCPELNNKIYLHYKGKLIRLVLFLEQLK